MSRSKSVAAVAPAVAPAVARWADEEDVDANEANEANDANDASDVTTKPRVMLSDPHKVVTLQTSISLLPKDMTPFIVDNIHSAVRRIVEGKCSNQTILVGGKTSRIRCFVRTVLNFLDIEGGLIDTGHPMCAATYYVTFKAEIIEPVTDSIMAAKVEIISEAGGAISCVNHPMGFLIPIERMDSDRFAITPNCIYDNEENITIGVGDYVYVRILAYNFYPGDETIRVFGNIVGAVPGDQISECDKNMILR
jgi:DNA-directed RNA polymerase subunit E'/Rpb7